jgi:hypothetical protein
LSRKKVRTGNSLVVGKDDIFRSLQQRYVGIEVIVVAINERTANGRDDLERHVGMVPTGHQGL